ncbi:MAG: hypothetical protein GY759_20875 [Chloroflexi bacterium]|nr:hypothetical protein [Chloroflexota bacterium]
MTQYQILYWYDIPTQVRAKQGRTRSSQPLAPRFMEAVDRAAMKAGLSGSDGYMSGFRWSEAVDKEGTPKEVATAIAAEIEGQYPQIDWRKTAELAKNNRPAES